MRSRRQFMGGLGGAILVSTAASCEKKDRGGAKSDEKGGANKGKKDEPGDTKPVADVDRREPAAPLRNKPEGWDPMAYNRDRGNDGAIPESYLGDINGADGDKKHLGKHLPYQPDLTSQAVPEGHVALMWGDPSKGHTRHPNAEKGPANDHEGHWYNWIRIRKAADRDDLEETQSDFSGWPKTAEGDNGKYAALGGKEIASEDGKNTIYLAKLPEDVKPGDTVRIWAHCLTHGEYVDFVTLA